MLKHKNNYITERDQIKESQIVQLCTCCVTFLCKKNKKVLEMEGKIKKTQCLLTLRQLFLIYNEKKSQNNKKCQCPDLTV